MIFDVVIVGGGVVGLAIASSLSRYVRDVVLFEQCDRFGTHQSSHNSEVIHGGIYYEPGSLKARLCVQGRRMLYDIVRQHGIAHRKCGKIILAWNESQLPELRKRYRMGVQNGVEGLQLLDSEDITRLEPNASGIAAIHSPETGIIDSHALMSHYRRCAEDNGAHLVLNTEVTSLVRNDSAWIVGYRDSSGVDTLDARIVINAAGLGAQGVMAMAGIDPELHNLKLHMSKGEYFSVNGPSRGRLRMLVYPIPDPNLTSLGIHSLLDLGGGLKLGPSVEYVDRIDYSVNPDNAPDFHESVKGFLPFLSLAELQPDMAGIRAKLSGQGDPARDFHIEHEADKGAPGFLNLAGIDSPGLTSSPAIGEYVTGMVREIL